MPSDANISAAKTTTRAGTSGVLTTAVSLMALAVAALAGVLWVNGVQEREFMRAMQAQTERDALVHATLEAQDTADFALRLNALQEAGLLEADALSTALALLPVPSKPTGALGSTVPLGPPETPKQTGALGSAVPTALPQPGPATAAQGVLLERIANADPDVSTPNIEFLILTGLLADDMPDRPTYSELPGLPELETSTLVDTARDALRALERELFGPVERALALMCGDDPSLQDGIVSALDAVCFAETLSEDPVCLARAIAAQAPGAVLPLRDAGLLPMILFAPWAVPCPDDIALAEQMAGRELQ